MTIGTVTATTVQASWRAPANYDSNGIIRYDIEVTEYQFGLPPVEVNTTDSSVIVTGLEQHNTFSVRVAAVSSSQVGVFSQPINFTTSEAGTSVYSTEEVTVHTHHMVLDVCSLYSSLTVTG